MNAERRPCEGAASESAGGPVTKVQRIGPPCGCQLGGAAHECGLYDDPRPTCSRRCQTLTIDEQRRRGETHGGCLCSPLPWEAA